MGAAILVVDDQPEMRFLISANLRRRFGFQIIEAHGFHDAIVKLNETKFKLIVSDYMMPDGSGFDLLDYVQLHPEIDCHFILFTSAAKKMSEADKERTIVIDKCHIGALIDAIEFLGVAREA